VFLTFQVLTKACPAVIWVPSGTEASLMKAESSQMVWVRVAATVGVSLGRGAAVSVGGSGVAEGIARAVWVMFETTVCTAAVCMAPISTGVAVGCALAPEQATSIVNINVTNKKETIFIRRYLFLMGG
jgi:hypothetical protein